MKDEPPGTPEYSGGWEIPVIRKILGIWDTRKDREIWETRKTRKATGNGEIGENRYTRDNLGTSWNSGGFRGLMCLGEPENLEIPVLGDCEIREFRKHREIREIWL